LLVGVDEWVNFSFRIHDIPLILSIHTTRFNNACTQLRWKATSFLMDPRDHVR
jgi:hypothetical protein